MILGNLVLASKTSRAPMSVASHVSTLTTTESIGSATHTPTNALSAEHAHRSARSLRYSSRSRARGVGRVHPLGPTVDNRTPQPRTPCERGSMSSSHLRLKRSGDSVHIRLDQADAPDR